MTEDSDLSNDQNLQKESDRPRKLFYPGLFSRLRTAIVLIIITVLLLTGAELGGWYAWGLILFNYLFLLVTAQELVAACALSPLHNTLVGSVVSRGAFYVSLLFTPTLLLILRTNQALFFGLSDRALLIPEVLAGSAFTLFCCLLPIIFQTTTAIPVLEKKSLERIIAVLFVSLGGGSMMVLAGSREASTLFLWFVLVVAVNDSAAYFIGARFSSPHLSPVLSPKKTTLGSLAGLVAGVTVGLTFFFLLPITTEQFFVWWPLLFCGILFIVLLAQLGDLLKSMIKRAHGIKDMGNVLPGHGGVLDRIDGMLLSSPFALTLLYFLYSLS